MSGWRTSANPGLGLASAIAQGGAAFTTSMENQRRYEEQSAMRAREFEAQQQLRQLQMEEIRNKTMPVDLDIGGIMVARNLFKNGFADESVVKDATKNFLANLDDPVKQQYANQMISQFAEKKKREEYLLSPNFVGPKKPDLTLPEEANYERQGMSAPRDFPNAQTSEIPISRTTLREGEQWQPPKAEGQAQATPGKVKLNRASYDLLSKVMGLDASVEMNKARVSTTEANSIRDFQAQIKALQDKNEALEKELGFKSSEGDKNRASAEERARIAANARRAAARTTDKSTQEAINMLRGYERTENDAYNAIGKAVGINSMLDPGLKKEFLERWRTAAEAKVMFVEGDPILSKKMPNIRKSYENAVRQNYATARIPVPDLGSGGGVPVKTGPAPKQTAKVPGPVANSSAVQPKSKDEIKTYKDGTRFIWGGKLYEKKAGGIISEIVE